MAERFEKKQQSKEQASTRETGSGDAPKKISTNARHIGPGDHGLAISGGYLAHDQPAKGTFVGKHVGYTSMPSGALALELFREFSDASAKWKVELYEKGPDGEVLLATFTGTTNYNGHYLKLDEFTPKQTDLPESQRCLLPVVLSRKFRYANEPLGDNHVYYVPLKGHQDYPCESWTVLVKCHVDGEIVDDDDYDSVHVYIDWPTGSVVYPMLGAPALVNYKDHWLELLVALDRPLAEAAEKFLLKTMLRVFAWDDKDKDVRQDAIKKRTFKLADPEDWFDFRQFKFADIGTDAKDATGRAERGDVFTMRLGQMDHFNMAEAHFTVRPGKRESAAIAVPVLCYTRDKEGELSSRPAPKASALHLYKVRAKLEYHGPGGGPLGEFTESRWTRRSRPSGSVFTLSSSSIKLEHIAAKRAQAQPRRCVHDCERVRVRDGRFHLQTSFEEATSLGADRLENAAGSIAGSFYYLEDPEDPSLNNVEKLALVTHTLDGRWHKEIAKLEKWGEKPIVIDDPNGKGDVQCWQYGYHFTKKQLGLALHQNFETYMVLMYGGAVSDNWVISVKSEVVTLAGNPASDAVLAKTGYVPGEYRVALLDVKFPFFDGQSPRWKTK